eukprot:21296_3
MTGKPVSIALSMTLRILSECASESEPPSTVKSWLKTYTMRPLIVPCPVTTESPGNFCFSMPKSVQRCSTSWSYSMNEPSSSKMDKRSRAVSLPFPCCTSTLFIPPPIFAC